MGRARRDPSVRPRHQEEHRIGRSTWLRAAVLGADDGVVSTASLIIGVSASSASKHVVLIAGVAGVVAGAMSMAAGEYVSVSSQRDVENADIALESKQLSENPRDELAELAAIYEERGLDRDLAKKVADQLSPRPSQSPPSRRAGAGRCHAGSTASGSRRLGDQFHLAGDPPDTCGSHRARRDPARGSRDDGAGQFGRVRCPGRPARGSTSPSCRAARPARRGIGDGGQCGGRKTPRRRAALNCGSRSTSIRGSARLE
jgi:VIT family